MDSEVPVPGRDRRWVHNPDLRCCLILTAIWVFFFSDPLFSSKNFYFRDILNFHYPLRRVLIDSFARWEFPLWNPSVYLGQPMMADPNYMAFYPTNLFHLFLPFNYAFKLHLLIHPLLAGVGIYFLQKRLGISPTAALAGSLVYQTSGTVLSFLNLYNFVPAVALVPWAAWAFLGACVGNRLRRTLLFGLLLGLLMTVCDPILLQCSLWLIAGLWSYQVLKSEQRFRVWGRILRTFLVALVFAFCVAAVQILPTLELLPHTVRAAGYDFATVTDWSMHPFEFLNVVVPHIFGNPYTLDGSAYWGEPFHRGREGYLVSFFLGTGTLMLVLLSIFSVRKCLQRILIALAALGSGLAIGSFNPLYPWLYEHLPSILLGRYPSKYFLLTTIAFSILAALGFEVLAARREGSPRPRRLVMAVGIIGLAAGGTLLGTWLYCRFNPSLLETWIRYKAGPALAGSKDFPTLLSQLTNSFGLSGIFWTLWSFPMLIFSFRGSSHLPGAVFLALLAAELIPANLRLAPLIEDAEVNLVSEVNTYLRKVTSNELARVVPLDSPRYIPGGALWAPNRSWAWLTTFLRRSGQPLYGIMDGLQYSIFFSVDNLNTRESHELYRVAYGSHGAINIFSLMSRLNSPAILTTREISFPGLRLSSSFDTGAEKKLKVYWLDNFLPRAYFVSGVERASSPDNALQRFIRPDFPFDSSVILENGSIQEKPGHSAAGHARILEYRNSRVVCEVEAAMDGYLVLLDSRFRGWRASVDGRSAEILPANYAFRAVRVLSGKHKVEFIYHPNSFYSGLALTCLALLFGATFALWGPGRAR